MISLEAAAVTFSPGTPLETRALAGIDLQIEADSFVTLIGSNGAGKSTLLNVLAGTVALSEGRLMIDGADVTHWPARRRARLVGRVFQNPLAGTCEGLSIEENLALADSRGRRRGLGPALSGGRRKQFRESLATLGLGLEDRLGEPVGRLSGGQRQALSLLMATLQPLSILLLDEHTAALDPRMQRLVLDLTDSLVGGRGLTTLMVTHSMADALGHGDRTVMLHEGKVLLDVAGEERAGLGVGDLVRMFSEARGESDLSDDALLLS